MIKNKKIVILGAGISGLATALQLQDDGFDITVLEKNSEPGGSMISEQTEGFLVEYGPNSGLETTPVIRKIVDSVGLSGKMIYANEKGNKRYILKNNQLFPLPMGGSQFLKTKLFSTKAKLRLLKEPFVGKSEDGYYQSISDFVRRRLGQEFLDYAINPFVAGVYAGNPDKLSVKSAFPKLYRLEEVYGGLIKGMIKGAKERKNNAEKSKQNAKMFSFKNGMQSLPKAIASKIKNIEFNCEIKSVQKDIDGYKISYIQNGEPKIISSPKILSTLPAYVAAKVFKSIDEELSKHLNQIYYPPVMALTLGFDKANIGQSLDGFGYLIPAKENKSYLGAIWSSVIFEGRAGADKAVFTIFVGGARSPELFDLSEDKLIQKILLEFKEIMQISSDPVFMKKKFWHKAIPQYNIGYIEHENYFNKFEADNPGLYLSGNYRGGISVGDCIKNSETVANKIEK
ncbi:protoporphyrinogen oxidase [bacterium BMS3Abin04]|nr:protoporphyrinogen oxidase [bacterium BMS3Abin04]